MDIAVWATAEVAAQARRPAPVLVVECRAESVGIHERDFYQGRSYASVVVEPCEFLVMHTERQTEFYRVQRGFPVRFVHVNDIPRAGRWGDAARLRAIRENLREFGRKEFQDLLHKCYGILRDDYKMKLGWTFDAVPPRVTHEGPRHEPFAPLPGHPGSSPHPPRPYRVRPRAMTAAGRAGAH